MASDGNVERGTKFRSITGRTSYFPCTKATLALPCLASLWTDWLEATLSDGELIHLSVESTV
jgi:hypothetical protein